MELESLTVAFVNAATDYLITLDLQGHVVFANRAFRNAFLGGAEPKGVDFVSLVNVESGPRLQEALSAVDSSARQLEVVHKTPDGRIHPVHYSLCRMDLEDLRLVGAVGRNKTADLELLGEITQLNLELENKQRELAEAYSRQEQLAVTDQITGLYNRHYFFTVVQHFFEEARRYGQALICFMLDVDHFKSINDTYGHMFGDHSAENHCRTPQRGDPPLGLAGPIRGGGIHPCGTQYRPGDSTDAGRAAAHVHRTRAVHPGEYHDRGDHQHWPRRHRSDSGGPLRAAAGFR